MSSIAKLSAPILALTASGTVATVALTGIAYTGATGGLPEWFGSGALFGMAAVSVAAILAGGSWSLRTRHDAETALRTEAAAISSAAQMDAPDLNADPMQQIARAREALAANLAQLESMALDSDDDSDESNGVMSPEIMAALAAASKGDFSARASMHGADADAAQNLNTALAAIEAGATETERVMRAFASGDFSARIRGRQVGTFASVQENIELAGAKCEELFGAVESTATEIRTGLDQIVSGAKGLSERTESQAASLEETAATMEEMAATVKTNAENAANANTLSAKTTEIAVNGGEIASEAVRAIRLVAESAGKITEITGLVDEIAFQTNLLALNAAVEAARAGSAGQGFAVVAQEVRTLAQRASDAASEIKTLIAQSSDKVSDGVELVEATGQSLAEIREAIGKVAGAISEITAASQEQSNGVDEISATVSNLDNETQQNAALAAESAASAADLSRQTDRLSNLVIAFRSGNASAKPRAAAPSRQIKENASDAAWRSVETKAAPAPAPKARAVGGNDDWSEF